MKTKVTKEKAINAVLKVTYNENAPKEQRMRVVSVSCQPSGEGPIFKRMLGLARRSKAGIFPSKKSFLINTKN